ncbi:MAG TPA: amino acid adenylation domain-containing protein [Acidisarcina sp.]|nr:amino acid adenylation domain-containing protein [Acidisarcina sp.]
MGKQVFPASFAQQRLWFLDQLDPGTSAYNLPRAFHLTGVLDAEQLCKSVQTVILRHASLRTIFTSVEGVPSQVVLPEFEFALPMVDLSNLPPAEREQEVQRILGQQARAPFDLSTGPLLRSLLLRLGAGDHIFLLVMHHIVTDGWSMSVLLREIGEIYASQSAGRREQLPNLPLQYSDVSQWQRDAIAGDLLAGQLDYWTKKLHGAETVLSLPTDHPSTSVRDGFGKTFSFNPSPEVGHRLKSLAQGEGATLFMALLSVFQILLWRYTLQDSILVGIPAAGRGDVELENLVGLFVNTLIIRSDLNPDSTFRQILSQARTNTLEALAQQDLPFEKLVEALDPVRAIHRNPLFQVMFIFQNTPRQKLQFPGLLLEEIEFESGIAKFGLSLEVFEMDALHCTFEYESALYDEATIARMAGHFLTLLEGVIQAPDEKISRLPLLTAEEVTQFTQWNHTSSEFPREICIQTAFEEQAARTPEGIALIDGEKRLSYSDLDSLANRLAQRLTDAGVLPGDLVGISLPRSIQMVAALLAVLKAGGAYVPLEPNQPEERLRFMVEDSQAAAVITFEEFASLFRSDLTKIVLLDDENLPPKPSPNISPSMPLARSSDSVAYVVYTSGSTGTPKGVQGTHRATFNRFAWMWNSFPFTEGEVCCQKTPLGFVDSIWEIFGPLLHGVASVILPPESLLDPEEMVSLLARHDVTRIVLIPSLLQVMLDAIPDLQLRLPRLKLCTCSGEVLPAGLAKQFTKAMPEATLLNLYGSSEVAADVTCHVVTSEDEQDSVPIGRPISNVQLFIMDRCMNQVPQGVPGELYVGGECLSPGYWKRPEQTAERFLAYPLGPGGPPRLFRTGDLAKFLQNGELQFLGRMDNQVKVRGIRVELGEIEVALSSHAKVQDAVVLLAGPPSHQKLAAYVVLRAGANPNSEEFRRFLRSKLPEYMIPSDYLVVKTLPLLPSGKIDRRTLATHPSAYPLDDHRYIAPHTATQQGLAAIWRDLLKVGEVGITDNFFELGGHSLMVMQVIARIRKIFNVEVSLRSMFENPTIEGLAEEVENARANGSQARAPILSKSKAAPQSSKQAILEQLNQLSGEELEELLKQVLKGRQTI